MEFKITVTSKFKGPIDQYLINLKNADKTTPGDAEMHILRTFYGVDIIFHAEGYDQSSYAALSSHAYHILETVKVPSGADVVGWF